MRGAIRTIARKELKSSFLSPIALIFLGVFLVGTLFIFFTYSKFFVRNLADVRPLFSWLPVLLIFLVSAVTMRQWSEEQKMGTLEILLTLPLRTRDLVLGKFLAGMALVALALSCSREGEADRAARLYARALQISDGQLNLVLPALEAAEVVVAHGSSCRSQIAELAGLSAIHPASFIAGRLA